MQQFLIAIIVVLGLSSYYLYNENKTLTTNNALLEGAIAQQEEAIKAIQEDFELQTTQLNNLTIKSQAAQRELNRYSQFIQNYELSAKILADPKEPMWIVITPDNWEDQLAMIEQQEGELVFVAMTIPDYEVMAYNMQELKRYITELKDVVVYYREVTIKQPDEK